MLRTGQIRGSGKSLPRQQFSAASAEFFMHSVWRMLAMANYVRRQTDLAVRSITPARRSIDAKIILWLKYFGRWGRRHSYSAPSATTGLCVSSPSVTRRFEARHAFASEQ